MDLRSRQTKDTKMIASNYYHIFNHANGKENLFEEDRNYDFFLEKIPLYIFPYVKLHAYCLLPNHFHFLIYVRDVEDLIVQPAFKRHSELSEEDFQNLIEQKVSKSFSNLFSCYAQSFNKMYKRKGSLFIPNMKQILVEDTDGICKVVHYIHANPVHHSFVKKMEDWKLSSYESYLSENLTKISRTEILDIFGGMENFIKYHQQPIELKLDWDL